MVYTSSDLPPLRGSVRDFIFPNSRNKNSLRLSSSLQDFSTYNQLDPEEGNLNLNHGLDQIDFSRENSGTGFLKEKPSPKSRKWVILVCFLFIASLIYTSLHLYSNWSKKSSRFFVVLDCGSTGTRVYIYQASINHQKDQNLPILLKSIPQDLNSKPSSQSGRAYNRKETEPGFDKLVNNVTGLTQAINPLLYWAEKQIPKHAYKSTSLFLYATAGVRRLPAADSDWVLNNAWMILKNSSFVCKREWVKIISGTEEAFYGWIALNYHTHMLGDKNRPNKQTYGALDLGGSSLQVTFETNDYINTTLNVTIGKVNHRLSAYSLSGYGLNDAFDKSVLHLLKMNPESSNKVIIRHPCLQSGYDEHYIGKNGNPVRLIGAPNWEACCKLAKLTLNSSELSKKHTYGQFYAMSGFYVVYRFFNLSDKVPLDEVLSKGRKFCEESWEVAKSSVPAQPFIEQYCFRAPYVVLLLREGLGIKDSQVNIGSGGITWTTGVALLEAGKVIWTRPGPGPGPGFYNYKLFEIEMHPLTLLVILLGSLCLVAFVLSLVGRRFSGKLNLPVFRHRNVSGNSVLNISSPFNYRRWSPVISGEGRMKTPLSPVARGTDVQLADSSSLYPSIPHSISSGSLGQMQFDSNGTLGAFYPSPHRGRMHLQSRRSQSRDDLVSSLSDTHTHLMKI
ncbi:unnamed protein product [Lactuca saligna]|uniref:Uncharacterized protein n=1 Tax=Lactuca saligna TaxID=75948 RepID=A0AA35ZPC7_LACSI|nr:unnamed protein product [Lactuca saligna]